MQRFVLALMTLVLMAAPALAQYPDRPSYGAVGGGISTTWNNQARPCVGSWGPFPSFIAGDPIKIQSAWDPPILEGPTCDGNPGTDRIYQILVTIKMNINTGDTFSIGWGVHEKPVGWIFDNDVPAGWALLDVTDVVDCFDSDLAILVYSVDGTPWLHEQDRKTLFWVWTYLETDPFHGDLAQFSITVNPLQEGFSTADCTAFGMSDSPTQCGTVFRVPTNVCDAVGGEDFCRGQWQFDHLPPWHWGDPWGFLFTCVQGGPRCPPDCGNEMKANPTLGPTTVRVLSPRDREKSQWGTIKKLYRDDD